MIFKKESFQKMGDGLDYSSYPWYTDCVLGRLLSKEIANGLHTKPNVLDHAT